MRVGVCVCAYIIKMLLANKCTVTILATILYYIDIFPLLFELMADVILNILLEQ